jgi:iron complex transport system ATP-binding protein
LRLLKSLAATTGKCIFYSTHDLDLALQLSDEIVVMSQGRIAQGTPQELIEKRALDHLFDDEGIVFDPVKGGFIVKK